MAAPESWATSVPRSTVRISQDNAERADALDRFAWAGAVRVSGGRRDGPAPRRRSLPINQDSWGGDLEPRHRPHGGRTWSGSLRVHPHKHDANYPPQKD